MEPILLTYRAMLPGVYRPQSPPRDVTVTAAEIADFVDAVNRKQEIGAPVVLKLEHRDGQDAIECGVLRRAWIDGEAAWIEIAVLSDAVYKGEVVRTQQQIADGIRTGMMTCSWEGWYNYQSPAYTGDRKFRVWPTGYAVLLGGDQPAIPSAVPAAAADNTDPAGIYLRGIATAPVRGEDPLGKGEDTMTLEQAMAKIAELEAKIAEMEKAADKGKDAEVSAATERATAAEGKLTKAEAELARFRQAEADALKVKAGALETAVLAKVLPGQRDAMKAKLAAMDSDATRVQFLELMDPALPALSAEDEKLGKGDEPADASDPQGATIKAAEKLAESEKITYSEALKRVIAEKQKGE